ncbi:MAG: type II toxin-antitoxin system RelE/ParE family toxin [Deferribacteraceae bacterium]|jgi:mRNA-degrading endonuclease RelE of RelBE toxin-antitoxin system|nr:type II toxin-antitoxin system RelE/ParE family toxin [Deferribacteraceae bacterium]
MNKICYQPKAAKQLLKIPERKSIRDKIALLAEMPDCEGVKKLTNHKYQYRLRVGRYRVFFNFDGHIQIVSIEEVKIRNESTY